jgi:hypothetical protein
VVVDELVCGHVSQNLVCLHYGHDQGENSENDVHHLCERKRKKKKKKTRKSRRKEKDVIKNGVHLLCVREKVCNFFLEK